MPLSSTTNKKKLIVDEATYLCYPTLDFTDELFAIIEQHRSYLEEFLPWVKNIKKEWHANGFLKEAMLLNKGKQRLTTLVIHQEQLAGTVSLLKIDRKNNRAELGYWLRADLQGKGIMTKSCLRLIQYAFNGLQLNRLEMQIAANNLSSRKIPIRLQFTLEGRLRAYQKNIKNTNFEDVEIFGLLKKEWLRQSH